VFLVGEELKKTLRSRLTQHQRQRHPDYGLKRAAVAVVVMDYRHAGNVPGLQPAPAAEGALLLTRRSSRLRNHRGQWALPGGKLEADETPVQAALREAGEEVALELAEKNVLGLLDDYVTRSGYHITPVVVWAGITADLHMNRDEVESLHRISFTELLRQDSPWLSEGVEPDRPVLYVPVGDSCIASPTAAVLFQFREILLCNRQTRVSHYDQPVFAWK